MVIISINHICEVEGSDMTTILLKFVHTCLRHAQFIRVGSDYYDPEATVNIHIIIIKDHSIILLKIKLLFIVVQ